MINNSGQWIVVSSQRSDKPSSVPLLLITDHYPLTTALRTRS
jgi:hypothetical protein